ncbi:serine--tRNA ligase [Pseudactinotalea sp. Z1748]|uniref:serine--tRNA ligase n=1 Tax=Pseudactinotalea sp. Z1748 TaxID=3413027 RepID=UPI003C7E0512
MIDLKHLREDPQTARDSQIARQADPMLVDRVLAADEQRRARLNEFESLRAEHKALSRTIGQANPPERPAILARAKELAEQVKTAENTAAEAASELNRLLEDFDNIVHPQVPPGGEADFVVRSTHGSPRDFTAEGFAPKDHLDLGEALGAIDTERGAKVSGSRFYFLTGVGARLELAILNAGMDKAIQAGFTPMITPTLVGPDVMAGTGFLGDHAAEVYHLPADDLYLVGTSEVALAGYHADEILDLSAGPKRYAGWSACYRREAGSYGKDTRGIIRVHQFHKVEMFTYTTLDQAEAEHERLLGWEQEMLELIEVPYRVIDVAAGDLGSSAARKFDCEAWLPSRQQYLELTSTSNCTTFQARRLAVRERGPSGTRPVATLNGTLATTRWIVAILENHQRADGSVHVPEGLRPYLGGMTSFDPVA